ncbi:putative polysaccharide biosynthesis protein [Halalkalibacter nanhaiisediminis]|uniref:O-antigen/teichoic acid export membrane protein n=1 Tax=Halalkalibacter nanhaiisediminis TaxID=688079 RepID=A0A562QJJ7_9BACI|nr:polysaccharide biosynthesis protein [Halalkalibacter nanhaiisediminis]TWI56904.1 O-antigen/teichoic acid export membrane protein [Halalkalibacter nanhaiisediminis]
MADSKLMRGTMVLSAATLASKILGLIYLFPFTAIVGQTGIALYNYGYLPYTVLLSLATLGVPLAVSKFVSKYNALGDFHTGYRLFKSGLVIMSISGFIAFLILFMLAPAIVPLVITNPSSLEGNSFNDIVFTIRMVSVALIIVPIMSIIRGYFQGFQSMGPTAVSQVVEQIVRVVFILAITFAIVQIMNGSTGLAVGFAVFGAFIGALGGLVVLLVYWFKRKKYILKQVEESRTNHQLSLPAMYKELIAYALPLSFVGLAIPLFQLIDMVTFNRTLQGIGYTQSEAETFFAVFSGTAHKVILIPMALATALSITLVPTITKSFTNNDRDLLQRQITQTYQIILFLTIPAAVGLSVLSYPVFATLYGVDDVAIGGYILRYYAPITFFFSLFAVTAAILQGMNKQKFAIIALLAGLIIKLVTNTWMLTLFGPLGGVAATFLGYIVSIVITVWAIGKYAEFRYDLIIKRGLLILLFAFIMAIGTIVINLGMQTLLPLTSWLHALLVLLISICVGAVIYLYLGYRSNLAGQILGNRFKFLNKQNKHQHES